MFIGGLLWSGHNLAAFSLPLSVAPRQGRPFYLAAFTGIGGVAFAASSVAAGKLAGALPEGFVLWGYPLHALQVILLLSGVARLLAATLSIRVTEPGSRPMAELW